MLNKLRSKQGFTLIELLIVVAIIGILAAVAIPQFSKYRMRGFNSAATADCKNGKVNQEALSSDYQTYGLSGTGTSWPGATAPGNGASITGPLSAGTPTMTTAGAWIVGESADATPEVRAVGIGVSNGVVLQADTVGTNLATSYTLRTKHIQGDREYLSEAEHTGVIACENTTFAGASAFAATYTGPAAGAIENNIGAACAGATATPNWVGL